MQDVPSSMSTGGTTRLEWSRLVPTVLRGGSVHTMQTQSRRLIFMGAIAAAIVLAIIGVLYLIGDGPLDPGRQIKHALLFFILAVGALVVANFNRPAVAVR
jgi:hypothetical protein